MIRLLCAAALLLAPIAAEAKTRNDRAAVLAAVDRFMNAINTDDPAEHRASQVPEGMTFALIYGPDGAMKLRPRSNAEWTERAGKSKVKVTERYWSPKVLIHRDMAVFWAPYSLDVDGKRAHCGIDVFELVRLDGTWKIANAMWTIEPDGCGRR